MGSAENLRISHGLYARLHAGEAVLVNGVMRQGEFADGRGPRRKG
jgi:hypothetical protein